MSVTVASQEREVAGDRGPIPVPQDDASQWRPRRHRSHDRGQERDADRFLLRGLALRARPHLRSVALPGAHALQGHRAPPRSDADLRGDRGRRRRAQRGDVPRGDELLVQGAVVALHGRVRRPGRYRAQLGDRRRRARQGALGHPRGDPLHPGLPGRARPRRDRRGGLGRPSRSAARSPAPRRPSAGSTARRWSTSGSATTGRAGW